MITIFTVPKAYEGHIAIIQRNALTSWTLLEPCPEIILCGRDDGIGKIASEFQVRHEPDIEYNEHNTPMVKSLFACGQETASNNVMMYINADIILLDDFIETCQKTPPLAAGMNGTVQGLAQVGQGLPEPQNAGGEMVHQDRSLKPEAPPLAVG